MLCAVAVDSPAGDMSWPDGVDGPAPPAAVAAVASPPPRRRPLPDGAGAVRADERPRRPYSRGDLPLPPAMI